KNLTLQAANPAGSAIDVQGTLDLESSLVTQAQGPAAINVEGGTGGSATIRNTTIYHSANEGIFADGATALFNDTISGNTFGVDPEASRDFGANVTLTNTIVANNTQIDCGTAVAVNAPPKAVPVNSAVASLDSDGSCGVQLTKDPKLASLLD